MNIILSNTDSAPIYEQITRQLRAKIVSGELTAGQALFLINWKLLLQTIQKFICFLSLLKNVNVFIRILI